MKASRCGVLLSGFVALGVMGCAATPATGVVSTPGVKLMGETLHARTFRSNGELRASIRAGNVARQSCLSSYVAPAPPLQPNFFPQAMPGWSAAPDMGARMIQLQSSEVMFANPTGYERPPEFSSTNVQHAGIDESHIIKTDGSFIYTVTDQTLFIVDAREKSVVGTAMLPGPARGMFLSGDDVAVVGQFVDHDKLIKDKQVDQLTYVAVYDVSTRSDPERVVRHVFEGQFVDGRLLGDVGYFVLRSSAFARAKPTPVMARDHEQGHVALGSTLAFHQPRGSSTFATVHAVKLSSPKEVGSKSVLVGDLSTVYMSYSSLYLADTSTASPADLAHQVLAPLVRAHLTDEDRTFIELIESTDDAVLSDLEKKDKIAMVYCDRLEALEPPEEAELRRRADVAVAEALAKAGGLNGTAIHRFDVDGLDIALGPTGAIEGRPLNQFAFDEHKGTLRVAATRSADNAVFALNRELEVVGKLDGLGKNERIYAARFMGDRAYLVTFRQIDPFYVIDASVPKKMRMLGELKIPGVSHYLHPWGANHVIGIGSRENANQGLKIALFDVSNVQAPREEALLLSDELRAEIPTAQGHRALIMDRRKQLLVVPVWSNETPGVGALVVNAGTQKLSQRGMVFHDDAQATQLRTQSVEGVLYIGDTLFTKSPDIIKASGLADLEDRATVFLK